MHLPACVRKRCDEIYNEGKLDFKRRAQISQYAENVYFGKPSGLMDQMASSAGGLVYIDFQNDDPEVREISYDFAAKGYALVVVNSGGSHDNLTEFYAAIPQEMRAVAACFGETYVSDDFHAFVFVTALSQTSSCFLSAEIPPARTLRIYMSITCSIH